MRLAIFEELKSKIRSKKALVAVIGLGYVGLPLAVEFAKKGFHVQGIDTDMDRIKNVKNFQPYILDVPIEDIKKVVKAGRLVPTHSFSVLKGMDVIIICVPTPLKRKYQPNISYIVSAVKEIARHLRSGQLVILESTTYPGTTEEVIKPLLEKNGMVCGEDFYLAFSPERIDPGNERYPLAKIPKIVGGITEEATLLVNYLYSYIIEKVVMVSSSRVAETVKLLENTFRLVNIGLINEMAMMAHKMDMDIWEVIEAAKTKPFGFMAFYPGPGVGGHCIPKDPLYLYWKAKLHGFKSRFIKLASDLNSSMPEYIVHRTEKALQQQGKSINGALILILGVTYKKDVKDLRKSPALELIDILHEQGAHVTYSDPLIPYLKINHINLKSQDLTKDYLSKVDCVIIATEHSNIDYDLLAKHAKLIFDTRNIFKGLRRDTVIRL